MTHVNSLTPSDITSAVDDIVENTKRAKDAALDAVKSARDTATEVAQQTRTFAAEQARTGAAWTTKQAKEAHHVAEDHPMGLALGAFALGLGLGFLISRNLAR
ncbi:MAG: hypothetical protein ACOVOE_17145 [Caulobacter sp.]